MPVNKLTGSNWRRRGTERFGLLAAVAVMFGAFAVSEPSLFLTNGNLDAILISQAAVLLMAVGISIPLRAGEFDLSISSIMVLSMIAGAVLNRGHHPPLITLILLSLAIGAVCGAVNAILVVFFKINAFIATLGTASVLTGLAYLFSGGEVVYPITGNLISFSQRDLFGLPLSVYYGWVIALGVWFLFEKFPIGRYWLFAGGNPDAARLSGVRVRRVRTIAFCLSGAICGFAGLLLAGMSGSADPTIGPTYMLTPFAAALLGTAVVQPGRFNIIGTLIGVYTVSIGNTGLALQGESSWVSQVFAGAVLIVAVGLSQVTSGSIGRKLFRRRSQPPPVAVSLELETAGAPASAAPAGARTAPAAGENR
jgi:ribose transport system permease protein